MKKVFLMALILMLFVGCDLNSDKLILKGYYDSDEYWDKNGFQDYTDYCKYYYESDADTLFQNNSDYEVIKEEDIDNIISYFSNFENWMNVEGRSDEYDFDIETITIGDYIHIKTKEGTNIGDSTYGKFDNYSLYLYDKDSHTLIYIHSNI